MTQAEVTKKTAANYRWLEKNPGYHSEWMANHPGYSSWKAMIQRCTNVNAPNYESYGGRGITVHQEWIDSYEAFIADIGPKPGSGYSIDRIDNTVSYEPGNVRWATRSEQQRNKTSKVSLEAKEMIIKLRSEGMSWRKIADQLNESGISTPRGKKWYGPTAKDCFVRASLDR